MWPDVGIKCSPILPKNASEVVKAVLFYRLLFQNSLSNTFGYFCKKIVATIFSKMAQSCHTDGKVEKSFEIEDPIKINHKVTENLTIVLRWVPTSKDPG